jgi:endonuclease YncB( thermonuclease family)
MSGPTPYAYNVEIVRIHDGDTLTVSVDLGFRIVHQVNIRLAGINAPELRTEEGKTTLRVLAAFVAEHAGQWTARTFKSGEEKYGRWLAKLYAPDGTDVSAWLLSMGLAVPLER